MFSKLKNKPAKAPSDFRDLEEKKKKANTHKPKQPRRPNHMAYRAVSRPPAPGGGGN